MIKPKIVPTFRRLALKSCVRALSTSIQTSGIVDRDMTRHLPTVLPDLGGYVPSYQSGLCVPDGVDGDGGAVGGRQRQARRALAGQVGGQQRAARRVVHDARRRVHAQHGRSAPGAPALHQRARHAAADVRALDLAGLRTIIFYIKYFLTAFRLARTANCYHRLAV